jgi:protein NUD1
VSDNEVELLDVSSFPGLQLLYADRNRLPTVTGQEQCCHLEVLSIREQQLNDSMGDTPQWLDLDLAPMVNLRKLFVSSNRLSERVLSPTQCVASLQLLDVAACGIMALPDTFGGRFPHVRVLNLNFNALTDLGALAGMHGLTRLTAVGNRIARLRKLCHLLRRISRTDSSSGGSAGTVQTVDLRGNPLTVGFYPPALSGSGRIEGLGKVTGMSGAPGRPRVHGPCHNPVALTAVERERDTGQQPEPEPQEDEMRAAEGQDSGDREINDPYMIPPADVATDRKYQTHLDGSTRTRRLVVALMVLVSTGGTLQQLDGLDVRRVLAETEPGLMGGVCAQLEATGVLKKRDGPVV